MSCYAEGMPDLEMCTEKQFHPNTPLHIVKVRERTERGGEGRESRAREKR
jgi:hypothetical protein